MAEAFTAKNYNIERAPKRIELLGDKHKRPEPAQHIIEFPGGAIEVSRTSDGNYWAHIIVNHDWALADADGLRSAIGTVVGSRIMRAWNEPIVAADGQERIRQIAVLIKPDFAEAR